MLEPEIKYENCEEIYTGPGPGNAGEQTQNTKGGVSSEIIGFGNATMPAVPGLQKRNYNEHLQSMMSENPSLADPFNNSSYQSIAPHMGSHNYYGMQQPQQRKPQTNIIKVKRRRYETNLLFQHPFFNLLEDWDSARSGETITAKCLSCKVTLRGHKNVSSNFIKHMKRLHPELYKVYENYKLLKFQGWNPMDGTSSGVVAEQPYFDHSAFLEHITGATAEDHNSTETSSTPPTDVLEAVDCNAYPQADDPSQNTIVSDDGAGSSAAAGSSGGVGSGGGVRLVAQDKIFGRKQSRAEVDLSSKTLQQMSQMLDAKLNGFVTIAQLQEERKSMLELIDAKLEDTLNNSNADDSSVGMPKTDTPTTTITTTTNTADTSLQSQLDNLKRECEQLRAAVQNAYKSKQNLRIELETIDRTMRQRKIFVRNLPAILGEKPKQAAERLMRDHLQLPNVQIKQVFLLNGQNNKNKLNIVLELQKAQDANIVLKNCGNLKNTGIAVEHALGPHALGRKHKLLVLRKEILRRNAKLKVMVRNTQLLVGGKQFYWDAEDGICMEGQEDALEPGSGAVQQLKEATGMDMKEFLNVLKNYDVK